MTLYGRTFLNVYVVILFIHGATFINSHVVIVISRVIVIIEGHFNSTTLQIITVVYVAVDLANPIGMYSGVQVSDISYDFGFLTMRAH